ncbi:MAG: ACP phosphodiesterase [Ginsengibacter sp.]
MNYLAHAYLSFDDSDILTGNMVNDYVKGKQKYEFSIEIQKGMELHRAIDHFTDVHPVTKNAKEFFRPQYRLYAGAFVDIVYDHFLALDDIQFEEYGGLEKFTFEVYDKLEQNQQYFPVPFQRMFPFMRSQNWLYHYQFRKGIEDSFGGLVRRAKYLNESAIGFQIFEDNYLTLKECYEEFFPDLKDFSVNTFRQLTEY